MCNFAPSLPLVTYHTVMNVHVNNKQLSSLTYLYFLFFLSKRTDFSSFTRQALDLAIIYVAIYVACTNVTRKEFTFECRRKAKPQISPLLELRTYLCK